MLAVRTRQLTAEDLHLIRLAALSAAPGTSTLMKTELQSTRLCDLPEDLHPLSINGSHLNERGIDGPATSRQDLFNGQSGAEDHTVFDVHEASTPVRLHALCIEQLGQRHPSRFGQRPFVLATLRVPPMPKMGEYRRRIRFQPVGQTPRHTARRSH